MTATIAGFPHWEVEFDEAGQLTHPGDQASVAEEVAASQVTDLFVLCHGWNNNPRKARELFSEFFQQMHDVLDQQGTPPDRRIGTIGVIWPSMRWADEPVGTRVGGAASFEAEPESEGDLVTELKQVYRDPAQQATLEELARLLEQQPEDYAELERFQRLLADLVPPKEAMDETEEGGSSLLIDGKADEVFDLLGDESEISAPSGAAFLGSPLRKLWAGAKEGLRQATYWQMKHRAGEVGGKGLGPLIGAIQRRQPNIRVHLQGHSFGARVVSFALAGLPSDGGSSPVKSLLLVQGAFSHYAFADQLPHDPERGGALAGMASRVDGPIVATYSVHDNAVGRLYPLASMLARQDAAAFEDLLERWRAIGHDGAQAVMAREVELGPVGARYPFVAGGFVNLNGNDVIRQGEGPSGAHSDIFHPEIAWAALNAAKILD
jgi:hypothetical protein